MQVTFDWRRISRWCLWGTIAMLLWLLAPVARCSWRAFQDTPIGEVAEDTSDSPSDADRERVEEGVGFWGKLGHATQVCYARTPVFGQEAWKSNLLVGLAVATVLARLLAYRDARKRRTFSD